MPKPPGHVLLLGTPVQSTTNFLLNSGKALPLDSEPKKTINVSGGCMAEDMARGCLCHADEEGGYIYR